MEQKIKFSVAIPAFKRAYLRECIESVLAQTYGNFEIVIVNDASPEDLSSVVGEFDDPRIRYYTNVENCGAVNVVDNWNICLDYVSGDYVICMGDDDKLLPCCLEEYAKLIQAYPGLGVYHAWTQIINEQSEVVRMQEARPLRESVYSIIWHRWHGRIQFIGDFLFDVNQLRSNGGFYKLPLAWGSDDFSTFIAARRTGIANMQVPGFQYRINSQTISRTGNMDVKMMTVKDKDAWYTEFLKEEPDVLKDEVAHTFWTMLKQEQRRAMMKSYIYHLSVDMADRGLHRALHWLRCKKQYNIDIKVIGYAMIEAVKRRVVKRKTN